jgi:plastocyanin
MADRERVRYGSLQVLGLTLLSGALLAVMILLLVLGSTEDLSFFGVIAAVSVAVTFIAWRVDSTWARVLGLVGAVAVFGSVFFLGFGIFQIFSPVEFVVGLLIVVGFLLALIGGILALVNGRRDRRGPARAERPFRNVVLGVIAVASVVSVVGYATTRESVSAAEAGDATTVEMADFEFSPDAITTGGRVLVKNADLFTHDFTIEALDVSVDVGPGSDALIDLGSAAPGTYDLVCTLHVDPSTGEGMVGRVTVQG